MSNALKIPFPSEDDAEENYAEDVKEEKIFKYKRPLLILFLLVLGIAVFSTVGNQKKQIVEKKKLPEPSAVAPSEVKEATSVSLPAVNKSDPPKISATLSRDDNIDLAYKGDKDYLALNRYERFPRAAKKPAGTNKQKVRDTVTAIDNPLTLAGRGFDINRFSSQSRTGRHVGFINRLQKPLPKMKQFPEDHLDLQLTQAKSSKDLIFHPLRQALGDDNRQIIHQEDEKLKMKKPQVLDDIPETKLLLMEGDKSFLILRRASESLDLLSGNEKINRKKYSRW
ncbi:MAG: hypothetical protein IID17_02825 [Nitrospinae bacterium]|nr:hypothetical protein [Nitrospinota bacterium]